MGLGKSLSIIALIASNTYSGQTNSTLWSPEPLSSVKTTLLVVPLSREEVPCIFLLCLY